jgi:hypothetical protein
MIYNYIYSIFYVLVVLFEFSLLITTVPHRTAPHRRNYFRENLEDSKFRQKIEKTHILQFLPIGTSTSIAHPLKTSILHFSTRASVENVNFTVFNNFF